jgi:hypothetical protein
MGHDAARVWDAKPSPYGARAGNLCGERAAWHPNRTTAALVVLAPARRVHLPRRRRARPRHRPRLDPQLENDFETFAENWEGVAFLGGESLVVTSTVCPTGESSAPNDDAALICAAS